jgi:polyisoprenoid-binding protein YceI
MSNSAKTNWVIDPAHSEISFKVKHLMITNVKGVFNEFSGNVQTTGDNFQTSEINFTLNPASIDTGASDRDGHLKSADFFEVEKYPSMTFIGNSINESVHETGNYVLNGDLTIKEITKPVKLNVEFNGTMKDPWGNQKAGYSINGKINRKDWGLNWNALLEAGGVLVSDDVTINCDVQLVKQV